MTSTIQLVTPLWKCSQKSTKFTGNVLLIIKLPMIKPRMRPYILASKVGIKYINIDLSNFFLRLHPNLHTLPATFQLSDSTPLTFLIKHILWDLILFWICLNYLQSINMSNLFLAWIIFRMWMQCCIFVLHVREKCLIPESINGWRYHSGIWSNFI